MGAGRGSGRVLKFRIVSEDTVRAPRHILLEETLTAVLDALRARPASPLTRELLTEALRYQRVISAWAHRPPADAQRGAMFDCVLDLHARVVKQGRPAEGPARPPSAAPVGARRVVR